MNYNEAFGLIRSFKSINNYTSVELKLLLDKLYPLFEEDRLKFNDTLKPYLQDGFVWKCFPFTDLEDLQKFDRLIDLPCAEFEQVKIPYNNNMSNLYFKNISKYIFKPKETAFRFNFIQKMPNLKVVETDFYFLKVFQDLSFILRDDVELIIEEKLSNFDMSKLAKVQIDSAQIKINLKLNHLNLWKEAVDFIPHINVFLDNFMSFKFKNANSISVNVSVYQSGSVETNENHINDVKNNLIELLKEFYNERLEDGNFPTTLLIGES